MTQTQDAARPLTIAHRGGANLWPENTLEAFREAIALGVDGLEFDIQLSADGVLVVHHDARLKPDATRLNGRFIEKPTPRIDALALKALKTYDVGTLKPNSAYGRYRKKRANMDHITIPTLAELEELVAATAPPDFKLFTELKTDMGPDAAQAHRLADAYLEALAHSPLAHNHIVVSFDWRAINRVRQARPDIKHAYTTLEFASTDPAVQPRDDEPALRAAIRAASAAGAPWFDGFDWRDMDGDTHGERVLRAIKAANGRGWFAAYEDMSAHHMAVAGDLGLAVSAWTVNQPAAMRRCADMRAHAVITDRPDILRDL